MPLAAGAAAGRPPTGAGGDRQAALEHRVGCPPELAHQRLASWHTHLYMSKIPHRRAPRTRSPRPQADRRRGGNPGARRVDHAGRHGTLLHSVVLSREKGVSGRASRNDDRQAGKGTASPCLALVPGVRRTTAMEMTSLWKAKSASRSDLEISPRTRDSHIPTADPSRRTKHEMLRAEQRWRPVVTSSTGRRRVASSATTWTGKNNCRQPAKVVDIDHRRLRCACEHRPRHAPPAGGGGPGGRRGAPAAGAATARAPPHPGRGAGAAGGGAKRAARRAGAVDAPPAGRSAGPAAGRRRDQPRDRAAGAKKNGSSGSRLGGHLATSP